MTRALADPGATATTLEERAAALLAEVAALSADPPRGYGHGAIPLAPSRVVAFPRVLGDSRVPYGDDGFNLWVNASGVMHANEGLFSIFPRKGEGQEPSIAFFSRQLGAGDAAASIAGVPGMGDPADLRATAFERACAWHLLRRGPVDHALRIHAGPRGVVHFSLLARNDGAAGLELLLSSWFQPMLRHQVHETDEDRWFKKVTVHREAAGGARFVVDVNEDKDRFTSIANRMEIRRGVHPGEGAVLLGAEETPSRLQYLGGSHAPLHAAAALRDATFGEPMRCSGFRESAIAGDLVRLRIAPGACARVEWVVSFEDAIPHGAPALAASALVSSPAQLDAAIARKEAQREADASALSLRIEDDAGALGIEPALLESFFEHLKDQVEFCSLIKGHVQLSENSLIGIRDVFQALEGLLYWRPEVARAKMLEAVSHTFPDGRCPRQYSLPHRDGRMGRMDLRPFIDQGVWVISTIATYLRVTGDHTLLDEEAGFLEIVDEAAGRVRRSATRSTVLDHLRRILAYLLANSAPDTGCIRALHGDWNDALDGLGILPGGEPGYGNGVSVMASLQVLQNLDEMLWIEQLAGEGTRAMALRDARRQLAGDLRRHAIARDSAGSPRILHGWGHDRVHEVGGFADPDGESRDSATGNAFWVLSGLASETPELRDTILAAFRRLDSKYGIRTFHPAFPPGTPGVGRIGKLPPGTAENGAVYVHATAFAIMALFEMGEPRLAWEQLAKILPFTAVHERMSHTPFVMPNSYSENEELGLDGESMNDWQTGSSNVVLKTLLRHVVGFQPREGVLRVAPAAWRPFAGFTCSLRYLGRPLVIRATRGSGNERVFRLGGRDVPGRLDPAMRCLALEIPVGDLPPGPVEIAVIDPVD